MHFSKCQGKNVFKGCSSTPHGHLWRDDEETHNLVLAPLLSTKKLARLVVAGFVEVSLSLIPEAESEEILKKLMSEIDVADLPEDYSTSSALKRPSHLKIVK
jgi:hypothetical protein